MLLYTGYEHKEMKQEKKDQGHQSKVNKESKSHKSADKKKKNDSKEQKHGSSKRNKSSKKNNSEKKKSGKKKHKKEDDDYDSDASGSSQDLVIVKPDNSSAINGTSATDMSASGSEYKPISVVPELAGLAPLPPAGAPVAKNEDLPEAEKMVADAEADVDRYERLFKKFEAEQFGKSFLKNLFKPVAPVDQDSSGMQGSVRWVQMPDGGKRYSSQGKVFVPESALPTPLCHLCQNASIVNQFENGTDAVGHRLGKATVVSDMLLEKKLPRGRRAIGVEEITEIVKRDPGEFDKPIVPPEEYHLQDRINMHNAVDRINMERQRQAQLMNSRDPSKKKQDRHNGPTWQMKTWDDGKDLQDVEFEDIGKEVQSGFDYDEKGKKKNPDVDDSRKVYQHPQSAEELEPEELLSLNHPIRNHHDPSSKPYVWPHQQQRGQKKGRRVTKARVHKLGGRPGWPPGHHQGNHGRNNHHHNQQLPFYYQQHHRSGQNRHRGGHGGIGRHKANPRRRYPHEGPRVAPRIPINHHHHGFVRIFVLSIVVLMFTWMLIVQTNRYCAYGQVSAQTGCDLEFLLVAGDTAH
jgi:hypothetical protein